MLDWRERARLVSDISKTGGQIGWPWAGPEPLHDDSRVDRSSLPKISVVTPSYNQGQFIEATIRSVLLQRYPNVQYIIMDGGSIDNTVEIIKKYDPLIAFWSSAPDKGQSHAINEGMKHATGDIVAYLNSDDIYLPGAFEAVAEQFKASPSADLFYGACASIDAQGYECAPLRRGRISSLEEALDLWKVWWGGRNFVQPEVFWTKRIAERVGPFREDLHYAMDFDYWCRIFRVGGLAQPIDQPLAAFRLWAAQKSTAADAAAGELLAVVRQQLWDKSTPLRWPVRLALQGDLCYSDTLLPVITHSTAHGESRIVRWQKVLGSIFSCPQLMLSRGLWGRVGNIATGRLPRLKSPA